MLLKIGELAKRTGLTVRALHHYDAIKLLSPSARSDSGYRLYNRQDIERLYRLQALRRLNLSLTEIAALLDGDGSDLQTVIEQQIAALDRQVARTVILRDRLKDLFTRVNDKREPDLSDWLTTLEMMAMYDKYFTSEELDSLRRSGENITPQLDALVVAVRGLMDRKVPPDSAEAQALSKPWLELSLKHMAGDARLIPKLSAMHRNEIGVQALTGVDGAMLDYMTRATAEFRLSLYARHLDADELALARGPYVQHYTRWPVLFAEVRELYEQGADPHGPEALDLCARWIDLFQKIWGSDPARRQRVIRVNELEPDMLIGSGMDQHMIDFVRQGIAYLAAQH
jgi:MerR family transcriptional regulator, thiopeptide resistance regulator